MTRLPKHYEIRPWRWVHFTPREIACKQVSKNGDCGCGGEILIDVDALNKLDKMRYLISAPFSPNSAYRCEVHNKNVGGAPKSMHRLGRAFDIPIKGKMTREVIKEVAKQVGFTGIGDYNTFVHVDTGRERYFDMRKK